MYYEEMTKYINQMIKLRNSDDSNYNNDKKIRFALHFIQLCLLICVLVFLFATVLIIFQRGKSYLSSATINVSDNCRAILVESIPQNLTFNSTIQSMSTFKSWKTLIDSSKSHIDLVVFYWTLNYSDVSRIKFPSADEGEIILEELIKAGSERNIGINIVQNAPTRSSPQRDSQILESLANAKVYSLDFNELFGSGILHTKMWIVDDLHVYIGSANMDWRSLTQVKELGIMLQNCPSVAADAKRIFEVCKYAAENNDVPGDWPSRFNAISGVENQISLMFNNISTEMYLSSSPPPFNANCRTNDVNSIVDNILNAEEFVHIAVMDYFPRYLFSSKKTYYSDIDNALRKVSYEKNVKVKLLASHWKHTRNDIFQWLQSLQDLPNIETKLFVVPAFNEEQKHVPYARVNHNKYMVTDKVAYIGTSNWSGDYFNSTGGVGVTISQDESNENNIHHNLINIFDRDWNSDYAHKLEDFL